MGLASGCRLHRRGPCRGPLGGQRNGAGLDRSRPAGERERLLPGKPRRRALADLPTHGPRRRGAYLNWLAALAFDPRPTSAFVSCSSTGWRGVRCSTLEPTTLPAETLPPSRNWCASYARSTRPAIRRSPVIPPSSCGCSKPTIPPIRTGRHRDRCVSVRPKNRRSRIGLGMRVRAGLPIDTDWALCLARNDPEIALRTRATRARWSSTSCSHVASRPSTRGRLRPGEQDAPAPSLPARQPGLDAVSDPVEIDGRPVPDVMVLKRPKQAIWPIADDCMEDWASIAAGSARTPTRAIAWPVWRSCPGSCSASGRANCWSASGLGWSRRSQEPKAA